MYDFAAADHLSREDLLALQATRLRESVAQALRSPHYSRLGLSPDDLRSAEDVRRLPLTSKDDLRAAMPWGMLAVPKREAEKRRLQAPGFGAREQRR